MISPARQTVRFCALRWRATLAAWRDTGNDFWLHSSAHWLMLAVYYRGLTP